MERWWRFFVRVKGRNALICLAFCLVVASLSIDGYARAARFDRDGVMVPVLVAQLRTYPDQRHRVVSRRTRLRDIPWVYFGMFDYTLNDQHFRVEQQIKMSEYIRFGTGRVEPMLVLAGDPTQFETTRGETRDAAWLAMVGAVTLGFISLCVAWWYALDLIREALIRRGRQTQTAVVTDIRQTLLKGRPTGHGQLFWQLADGQTGQSYSRRIKDFGGLLAGSQINVVVQGGKSYWVEQGNASGGSQRKPPEKR